MESRERSEPNLQDREQGTPQQRLRDDEPGPQYGEEPEAEGGADSVADAAGDEGG